MATMILRIKVAAVNRAEVVKIIQPIIGATEALQACSLCRLYCETDDDDALLLLQEWQSQEDLDKFIRSHEFKRVLAAMDLASKPPEFSVNAVSPESGMELVEKLRLGPKAP